MVALKGSLNEEKILLCCVCKQFMKDPQLLKCLHSCCKRCIVSDQQIPKLVNCPLCNEETSCEQVTENVFIASWICRLAFLRENYECQICNKDANYSCNSCCKLLCNECVDYHSKNDHAVLELDEITSINELDGEQFCNIDERPYTYACRECQKLKCNACVQKCSIEGHDTVLLDTGANDYALHVKEEVLCLKNTLQRILEDFIKKPTPTFLLKEAYRASSNELRKNKDRIVTALNHIFSAAKDELDFLYESLAPKASDRREHAKSLNDKSSQAVEYCEQISTAKATYLLEQQATLVKRLEYLRDEMEIMQTSYYKTDDITVETSATASIDETIKLWIGSLKKVKVDIPDGNESPHEKDHVGCHRDEVLYCNMAYSTFQSRVRSNDIILTDDGNLVLAALENGLIEFAPTGDQLSMWRPVKDEAASELVWAIESLKDRRFAAGLCPSNRIQLLRLNYSNEKHEWRLDGSVDMLQNPAYSLQYSFLPLNGQVKVAAVTKCANYSARRQLAGSEIVLVNISTKAVKWSKPLEYIIGCIAITDNTVVSASMDKVHSDTYLKRKENVNCYVIDGFDHSGQFLWRQQCPERVYDIFAGWEQDFMYLATEYGVDARRFRDGLSLGSIVQCLLEDSSLSVKRVSDIALVAVAQRNTEQILVYVGKNPSDDEGSTGVLAKTVLPLSRSLPLSSGTVSEKPDTTKLTPSVVKMKIREIEVKEDVLLSYYFGPDNKFIVHIEDQKGNYMMNPDKVKDKVKDTVKETLGNGVDVIVISETASCILTSVGADMSAFGHRHCMGMYLEGENAVYWFSVAHAYIAAQLRRLNFKERNVNVSVLASGQRDSSGVISIELPVPNLLLPAPPFGSTRAQVLFLTDEFPTLANGRRLRHSIDIMGGKLHPALLAQGTVGNELNCDLSSVFKKCPVCFSWFCNSSHLPLRGLLYNINGVSEFPMVVDDEGYYWYDCRRLHNTIIYCRPGGNESLAVGRVIVTDPINRFVLKFSNDSPTQYQMENILVIEPLGDVDPKQGHSGSVWVESPSARDMAVAITIGVSEDFSHTDRKNRIIKKKVWLAILMKPALEALNVALL